MKKYLLILILLIISLGFRIYHLDNRGLITDEKFTLVTSNGFWVGGANQSAFKKDYFTAQDFWEQKGIRDYFDAAAHSDFGTHIVYTGLIHFWTKFFGNSDFSIRLPGLVFNVLTVLMIFLFVLKYFESYWAAFLAALLFAIDPLNIAQSHIARSYPLSFFLILLSTDYFIKLVTGKNSTRNFIIYAVLTALSLLNHYINFFVPLAQIIIFLSLRNKRHLWRGFAGAAVFNLVVLIYWFNWGGGYTAIDFLKDKNQIHSMIADNPDDDLSQVIRRSTPDLIVKKGIELFYDIGVIGHQLFDRIKGVKIFFISFLVFLSALPLLGMNKRGKIPWLLMILGVALMIINFSYFSAILISASIFFAIWYAVKSLLISSRIENLRSQYILLAMGILMLFIPLLFVINDAISSGNTTSLTHRYIGNASVFVVILMGVGIVKAVEANIFLGLLFLIVFAGQWPSIERSIQNYYDDLSPYNAYFIPARVKNPYIQVAGKLKELAVKGDTIVIPGAYKNKYEERFHKDMIISYNDAQYLNLYFDKNFEIVQHVDKNEREKLFLKKKNGDKLLIFDFKGEEYRY